MRHEFCVILYAVTGKSIVKLRLKDSIARVCVASRGSQFSPISPCANVPVRNTPATSVVVLDSKTSSTVAIVVEEIYFARTARCDSWNTNWIDYGGGTKETENRTGIINCII